MRYKLLLGLLLLSSYLMFTACDNSEDPVKAEEPDDESIVNQPTDINGEMEDVDLYGFVYDTQGNPLIGVSVISGDVVTETNALGYFALSKTDVAKGRMLVRFKKYGYAEVVRSAEKVNEGQWLVVLCSHFDDDISTTEVFDASEGVEIEVKDMTIDLPSDGFVNAVTGEMYTGEVTSSVVYLDPNDKNFAELMPGGDMTAERTDGSDAMLISYGMTSVELTDDQGEKLQLKDGVQSRLEFPIPEGMEDNAPTMIPLWSFDESTGKWKEEGEAYLVGDKYVGNVGHFSWWNLDHPASEATVEVNVMEEQTTVSRSNSGKGLGGVRVKIGQVSVYTDSLGKAVSQVPAGQAFDIVITKTDYRGLKDNKVVHIEPLKAGEKISIEMLLPDAPCVFGKITTTEDVTQMLVSLTYGNTKTKPVRPNKKGEYEIVYPMTYVGEAVFEVHFPTLIYDKKLELTGEDVDNGEIIIDIDKVPTGAIWLYKNYDVHVDEIFTFRESGSELAGRGVWIYDDSFQYMNTAGDEGDNMANTIFLGVDGYKSSVTKYTGRVVLHAPGAGYSVYADSLEANITRSGDIFKISMSGPVGYHTQGNNTTVLLSGKNVEMSLTAICKSFYDVSPYLYGIPSFAPTLGRNAAMVSAIIESPKLGKGGNYWYRGDKVDFYELIEKANATGLSLVYEDEYEDEYGEYYEYIYYENNNLLVISYETPCDCTPDDYSCEIPILGEGYHPAAHTNIFISAFEGLKISLNKDDYFAEDRSSANKKQVKQLRSLVKTIRESYKLAYKSR